jgi:hypothetical protein
VLEPPSPSPLQDWDWDLGQGLGSPLQDYLSRRLLRDVRQEHAAEEIKEAPGR